MIIAEIVRPKPINWKSSYTSIDKIPFGSYILFEELNEVTKENLSIEKIDVNPFDFLNSDRLSYPSNYLFINSAVAFDKRSYEKLITYVREGNSVFISATGFGSMFRDSLKVETETDYNLTEEEVKPAFFSSNIKTQEKIPVYKKKIYKSIFKSFDTTKTAVLGYFKNEEIDPIENVNFIKINEGDGFIYLHTLPEAFSNYYMLTDNDQYAADCLSFLENSSQLYWDEYLKDGRIEIKSPIRYVLKQPTLKWAYYLLILGVLLFFIFRGKREQRIIPIVIPLENSSIEFTKTIGDLYFQYGDYGDIISKKITYFLAQIRSKHYLKTDKLNKDFIHRLASKTGHTEEETGELINYIIRITNKGTHNENDLIELNKKIEDFTI